MKAITKENIFIIDGIGAFLSTLCLVCIIYFEELFGIPKSNLYLLVTLGFLFSVYSITCHYLALSNWRKYLKIIAVLNTVYCLLTFLLLLKNLNNLTKAGYFFFFLELIIILTLVSYEFRIAKLK
jgi:K+ transporter